MQELHIYFIVNNKIKQFDVPIAGIDMFFISGHNKICQWKQKT